MVDTLYPLVLLLHSWNRWLIACLAIVAGLRSLYGWMSNQPWTRFDDRVGFLLVLFADLQLLLGIGFFAGISPLIGAALGDMPSTMKDAPLRFFTVEHPTMMLLALVALHIGRVRARKVATPRAKHRAMALSLLITVLLIFGGMPWPESAHGRPLFRF